MEIDCLVRDEFFLISI